LPSVMHCAVSDEPLASLVYTGYVNMLMVVQTSTRSLEAKSRCHQLSLSFVCAVLL
jgi:hypothetical protein